MVLLRRVIGDALRARRQAQHRTLREVSTAANVSLGYLSEIERGQKEASSELLASICDALGSRLSEVLHDVSHHVADAERGSGVALVPVPAGAAPVSGVPLTSEASPESYAAAEARSPVPAGATAGSSVDDELAAMSAGSELVSAGVGSAAGSSGVGSVAESSGADPVAGSAVSTAGEPGASAERPAMARRSVSMLVDGDVSVTVRQDTPLRATLRATRNRRSDSRGGRDVLTAA
jgi:transcriptional regulator with XRE-family HTH domain